MSYDKMNDGTLVLSAEEEIIYNPTDMEGWVLEDGEDVGCTICGGTVILPSKPE